MIHHMFIFGVLIPTAITVVFFVGFLICWFKFNIKEKLLSQQFFKKKKLKHGVCPKVCDKLPKNVTLKKEVKGQGHGGKGGNWKEPPKDDPDGDSGPLGYCNTAMSSSRPCSQCEDDRDTLSQSSGGKNMGCPHGKRGQYFVNPRHFAKDKELGQRLLESGTPETKAKCCHHKTEDIEKELCDDELIQQTFHFPDTDANQLPCLALDMTEDDMSGEDDGNYSHFIPKSQIEAVEAEDRARLAALQGSPGSKIYTGSLGQPPKPHTNKTMQLHMKQWQRHNNRLLQKQQLLKDCPKSGGVRFADHCTVIDEKEAATMETLPSCPGDNVNELPTVTERQRLVVT